ncbi:M20/M25/M40 family metallo-hydrolase [Nitratireductor aquibiodomus]|uniref:M20/M25/M40 family metallo-hydrolase n=1 Tax=Nitratireductor aquibiodomus TaxID=204799 RepID=UPI000A87A224|nr:M20/M25/M40 family metallo-hydrolase [Nitratireductor aquibiodomus]
MNAQPAPFADVRAQDHALAARLFDDVARMSPDVEGVSRPAFSEIETRTLKYLEDVAKAEGLAVWYDAGCNALFSLPEDRDAERFVVVGSHVDSVPFGGNFDGLAGVVAGLICLIRARREGRRFEKPVHVLAMRGEESAWFGPCYIGSKVLTGTLAKRELEETHKGDGRTLEAHMADIGLPVEDVQAQKPLMDVSRIEAYLELHIEQGPLLIGKNIPAAAVSGIRGNIRYRSITCHGEAGHSGAVPKATGAIPFWRWPIFWCGSTRAGRRSSTRATIWCSQAASWRPIRKNTPCRAFPTACPSASTCAARSRKRWTTCAPS